MSKNDFFTTEEKEFTEDSGLENLESKVEVDIMEKESEKENYRKAIDDDETNDKNKWLEEQAEKIFPYNNEFGKPYLRVLKMKEGSTCCSPYLLQHYENGNWVSGRGNCKYIPFNLPKVIDTVKNNGVVIITNGEKDATLLSEQFGFCSTTSATSYPTRWNNTCCKYVKNGKILIIKEESEEAKEFAKETLKKVNYYAKVAKCISIKTLCEIFNLECTEKTGVSEIRDMLQDDKKLEEAFQTLIDSIS